MSTEQKEFWSFDKEDFCHETLGDLIDSHRDELTPGMHVWRGTGVSPKPSELVDADLVIDHIGEMACDIGGEYAEGYPECTTEQREKLQALLEQWLSECPAPDFFSVTNVVPYTITEDDLS